MAQLLLLASATETGRGFPALRAWSIQKFLMEAGHAVKCIRLSPNDVGLSEMASQLRNESGNVQKEHRSDADLVMTSGKGSV